MACGSHGVASPRPWKGLGRVTLDEAGVEFESGLVLVPSRRPDGSVHNRHVFAEGGRCWWETPGRELIPFGLERLPSTDVDRAGLRLLVCEGESDALAVREAFALVDVGTTFHVMGLPGSSTWRQEWRGFLEPFDCVYLLGDGDDAGWRMMNVVLRDVPWARPVQRARRGRTRDPCFSGTGRVRSTGSSTRRTWSRVCGRRSGSLGPTQSSSPCWRRRRDDDA